MEPTVVDMSDVEEIEEWRRNCRRIYSEKQSGTGETKHCEDRNKPETQKKRQRKNSRSIADLG